MSEPILIALVAAVASMLGALVTAFMAWRKWATGRVVTQSDAAARLTGAAADFIDDLREQLRDQLERIKELEANQRARIQLMDEQAIRIDQLITDILVGQQQKRKLEAEIKQLKKRDAEMLTQIDRLRRIIQQAGLKENGNGGEDSGSA